MLLIGLVPVVALGAERPDWAFPAADQIQPPARDENQQQTRPGSSKTYTNGP